MSELMSAIGSVKTITDMLRTALDAKAFHAVETALGKLTGELVVANNRALQLQAENSALIREHSLLEQKHAEAKNEIARLVEWRDERANYRLAEVASGAFAYVVKAVDEQVGITAEPEYWLCCQCYNAGYKSILQFAGWDGSHRVHACHRCQARILERVESAGVTIQTVGRGRRDTLADF